MDRFFIELTGDGAVVEFGASLADEPIVGVVLESTKFEVGESWDCLLYTSDAADE